jgi:hypothetical protein
MDCQRRRFSILIGDRHADMLNRCIYMYTWRRPIHTVQVVNETLNAVDKCV